MSRTLTRKEEANMPTQEEPSLNHTTDATPPPRGTLGALTESEGWAIARFKSIDAFRTRLAEEGRALFSRVNQETLPAHQVHLATSQPHRPRQHRDHA